MLQCHRTLVLVCVLGSPAFADGDLPASLIRIPESVSTVFVAETSTSAFHRFKRTGAGIVHNGSFYMSIGLAGAGKQSSGDKRTPLGAYFVTEQLDTSKLHEKYGVTAFPLDYPNAWDLSQKRDGDGIWVHGVDPRGGLRPKRDTDGCISLSNADLATLRPDFDDNVTPVLITTVVDWTAGSENDLLRAELEDRVAEWLASQAGGDLFAYLTLYDDDFVRWGMDKMQWSSFVLQTMSWESGRAISLRELLLLGYPDEDDLYLSRFRLLTKKGERDIVSTTRLYWRRDAAGVLRIIAEDNG